MENIEKLKDELVKKQLELGKDICLENRVDISNLKTIAGVDLAYWKKDDNLD